MPPLLAPELRAQVNGFCLRPRGAGGQRKVNNGSPIGRIPREPVALNRAAFLVLPRAPEPGCNHF
jgi:hypothetical protein